ncbi:MAG: translation elongation factor Ts [Vicinamibacteria bacterium]|nr:translation elongation factor Ts [Vicinamibacteria bacterium]
MNITADAVKTLREQTGAGMMDCKSALVEAEGDMSKAQEVLRKKGLAAAAKRSGRTASEGMVGHYIHPGAKVGVLVEINCETDFVAKNDDFQALVRDVAMHIAAAAPTFVTKDEVPPSVVEKEKEIYRAQAINAGKPEAVADKIAEGKLKDFYATQVLLEQAFVRDPKVTIGQLIQEKVAVIKENIVVRRFARFRVGDATSNSPTE